MTTEIRITVRLPEDLHSAVAQQARAEDRSLNGQIVHLLRKATAPQPEAASKLAQQ